MRPSANGTIEFELSDLPDGQYYIVAVARHKAADDNGNPQISVKYLPINKDTSGNGESVVSDDVEKLLDDDKNINNNSDPDGDKGTDTGDDGVPLLPVILCMISAMIIIGILIQRHRQSRS